MRGWIDRYGPLIVLLLLGLQGAVFLWAMDQRSQDSGMATIYCTGGSGWLPPVYVALHLGFFAMVLLGAAALRWPGLRRAYIAALAAGLVMLTFQPALVESGHLTCQR